MAIQSVYPEQFFNVPHPTAPIIDIQFRTAVGADNTGDITESSNWTSITFNPNNFFNNMELEDSGGLYKLKLDLFDKNFANLENVVIRSIISARVNNQLVQDEGYATDPDYFEFYVSRTSNANLRIRFGYSEPPTDEYINATSLTDEEWRNRLDNDKTVLKSPWLYFQISGGEYKFTPKGAEISIKAFSIMESFLTQAKLVQRYARLYGNPTYVIEQLMNKIVTAAAAKGDTVTYEIQDTPRGVDVQGDEIDGEIIEIMLGAEPRIENDRMVRRYKTLRTLLNELCSAVKPMRVDENGQEVQDEGDASGDASGEASENERTVHTYAYSYYVEETKDGNEDVTNIVFYYKNPESQIDNQDTVRVYSWLQEGNSIVRELDINTSTDFATLNVPILSINEAIGEVFLSNSTGAPLGDGVEEDPDSAVDLSVGRTRDLTEALSDQTINGILVRHVMSMSDRNLSNSRMTTSQLGQQITSELLANLNEQVFKGTLKIPGDPFFLFGNGMQPFRYLIKVIVNRPNYVDEEGNYVIGGKSYLSGYYAITKITHTLTAGNFETNLSLMKNNLRGNRN